MTPQTVDESRQLLRLRALREDAARRQLAHCRALQAERQAVVDRRLTQIARLRAARIALLGWMSGAGACAVPQVSPYARAKLAELDDELERAEVELIDERNALNAADRELDAAQGVWARARARREAVERWAGDAQRALGREREQRAEREIDAPYLSGA